MSDIYNQIMNDKDSLEQLMMRIPGFKGYLDREARRDADRIVRDHLAGLLAERIQRLARIETQLLDQGGLAYMSKTSSVKTRLQTYHDRVKAAAPGYSGFFEAIKIESAELEMIYNFDQLQIVFADRFSEALDKLEAAVNANEGIEDAIRTLDMLAVEANEAFSKRDDVLTNLQTGI
jgi:predicted ribosome quality control (RQC) complex YloA/Tae2 family protein